MLELLLYAAYIFQTQHHVGTVRSSHQSKGFPDLINSRQMAGEEQGGKHQQHLQGGQVNNLKGCVQQHATSTTSAIDIKSMNTMIFLLLCDYNACAQTQMDSAMLMLAQ